ncbi:hypothetical protein HQ47_00360 [Porphyromonas macacae]|uniref:PqqD family protein n=1 Tax=Porphyromonas macacae TaxID=28115 RepID=A0A0A2EIR7_9PORP|nr:PqqD family protein [Porphyromonas macacae]KGN76284.1 hypothetical protein HQ47_00360 [Porphyromonas macacae]SUB88265.1 Uncharacterised protein [Porphyromonas macacae]
MQIKKNISLRNVGGENLLFADNNRQINLSRIISLNESAAYLFLETGEKEFTVESWANLLVKKYQITDEQAFSDAATLVKKLTEAGIID